MHHVGSAHTGEALDDLVLLAEEWIKDYSAQLSIFPDEIPNRLLHLNHCTFMGVQYNFFNHQIIALQDKIGLSTLPPLLKDLVTIRIFEPASKLRSMELLEQYFGIHHNRKTYYKLAPGWIGLKDEVEEVVMAFAKECYSFNYELLFYDVTTLYFETFEGHTIIPVVKRFIEKNRVKEFTVVADAAMISMDNINELTDNNINYIVGARLGNISAELLEAIDKNICREDGKSIRLKTDLGYMVCGYSSARYRKELHEMNNQIEKARLVVEQPSKTKKLKFIQTKNQKVVLNEKLIKKT